MTDKRYNRSQPPMTLRTVSHSNHPAYPVAGAVGDNQPRVCEHCGSTEQVCVWLRRRHVCKSCIELLKAEARA
jgi:hypothetical protein